MKEQKLDKNRSPGERKTEIKSKINLIYDSKLKDNDTRQNIRMKKIILTQISAPIDLIDCRIRGFSFRNFKDKILQSRGDFSLFFQLNLDLKHSLDAEMSLKEEEINRFKD